MKGFASGAADAVVASDDILRSARNYVVATIVLSLLYALVRYHVFKSVPWGHFAAYTLDEAISLSGLLLVISAGLVGKRVLPEINR